MLSLKILSWTNLKDVFFETFFLNKKLLPLFLKKLLLFYILLSFFMVKIVALFSGYVAFVLILPFEFVLTSAIKQLLDSQDEISFKWRNSTFLKWFCVTTISKLINLILMVTVGFVFMCLFLILRFVVISICFYNMQNIAAMGQLTFYIFLIELARIRILHLCILLPVGLISGLVFLKNGNIIKSALQGANFIFKFFPIFLLATLGFKFIFMNVFLIHLFKPMATGGNLTMIMAGLLMVILIPFIYIFYLSLFSSIYKKLCSISSTNYKDEDSL